MSEALAPALNFSRKIAIVLAHAFAGWALCAAIMGIGMQVTSLQTTLIAHAIGAPIVFAVVTGFYFSKFSHFKALQAAMMFVSFVMIVDFFVVALLINRSLDMFSSWLGTWLPFALIFASTYLTGTLYARRPSPSSRSTR